MKKTIIRALAVILVVTFCATILAGCRNDSTLDFETPDFIFLPEVIDLPEGIQEIRNMIYSDGMLYFWSNVLINEETWDYQVKIYSMNIDGTNLTELPNYKVGSPPYEDALGNVYIMSLIVEDGHLWVAESGHFYRLNVPEDFDGEEWERWDYYEDLGSVWNIRKIDKTGTEILSVDIGSLAASVEWFNVSAFSIDGSGNIYIGNEQTIYVLNDTGARMFQLEAESWIQQLIRMPDGKVANFGWSNVDSSYSLRSIDPQTRGWGETTELPQNAWDVYPGSGDYLILFRDSNNLYGIEKETGEAVKLLNWLDSNVAADSLDNISILPDGRIICTNTRWISSMGSHETIFELYILTRIPYADLPERTVLTLAAVWLDWSLRPHIVQFNRTNPTYRIRVIDYSEFNTEDDWTAGITRLSTDIIAGRVPDMLDVSGLPSFKQFVARDLLEDLYTFIDNDPQLNRSDFMEAVFRAAEMDGSLYRIFPSFTVNTIIGHPSVVGTDMGWTMDEFQAVLNANPQADMPMGQWLTKSSFLEEAIRVNMDTFVDWAAGKAHFDTGAFAQLLEFADRFPADFSHMDTGDFGFYIEEHELIASGRQIMAQMYLRDFQTIQMYRAMFGGEIVFKGFPTEHRNGNSLSIWSGLALTTRSSNQDGAWEFMRTILTAEWQRENISYIFPTNKAIFNEMVEQAMSEPKGSSIWGWGRGFEVEMGSVTQEDVDMILAVIESTQGIASQDEALMNIITENTEDFFNGRTSAQDAARIIQSRVSRLISEQS